MAVSGRKRKREGGVSDKERQIRVVNPKKEKV